MKSVLRSLALFGLIGAGQAQGGSTWPFWDHYAARFLSSNGASLIPIAMA